MVETPVTTRIMNTLRGSTRIDICASIPAVPAYSQSEETSWRCSAACPCNEISAPSAARNESAIAPVPISGNSSTSQPKVVVLIARPRRFERSPLQLPQLVHVDRQVAAVDRHDHAEPDADLAGGDDHHDDRQDLPVAVPPHAREGDQSEVRPVEHQLQAKQHDQRIAPRHHAEGAGAEDDGRDGQVPGDAHRVRPPTPSAIVPVPSGRASGSGAYSISSRSSSIPPRRRASTTPPTAAISSSIELTSNTSRKRVSSS